jgi:hypothetical protein
MLKGGRGRETAEDRGVDPVEKYLAVLMITFELAQPALVFVRDIAVKHVEHEAGIGIVG